MNKQNISGVDCFFDQQNQKWIPETVGNRFSALYKRHPDAPDFVAICEACYQHNFDVTVPFETFLCGYLWKRSENNDSSKMLSDTNMKLINAMADNRVLSEKLEDMRKRLEQVSTEYATLRNNVSQSDWQRAINEKDAMIAQLQEYINNAQRECQYQWNLNNEEHNNEMRKKMNEINELKSKHLDESVHVREAHMSELNEKDKQIVALQEHLNQTLGELEKARTNATNGVKNLLDQSARKELEAANTLATFKQAAWSLLERVLTSYDNTLSFIDNVGIAIRDCESIVRALWDQNDNNIYNRFSRVAVPNVSKDKEAVRQFKNQYLQDIDQEVEMMKRRYQLIPDQHVAKQLSDQGQISQKAPNNVMYLTNSETQSE